jgi:hypothetical protein
MSASGDTGFNDLEPSTRRRVLAKTIIQSSVISIALLVGYYVVPFTRHFDQSIAIRLVLGLVILAIVLGLQIRAILTADYPVLRAIVGFAFAIPLLLIMFAVSYLLLSAGDADSFNEELNHTGALYLSMMTGTTVGFGDISPSTDTARVLVMFQMLTNVVVIGLGARLMISAAQKRVQAPKPTRPDGEQRRDNGDG